MTTGEKYAKLPMYEGWSISSRLLNVQEKSFEYRNRLLKLVDQHHLPIFSGSFKMLLDEFRKVLLGELSTEEFVSPLSASLIYFSITMLSGYILRTLNNAVSPDPIRSYISDFSATLEMCAYFYENAFIFKHYGTVPLALLIIAELFISNRTFFGASVSPCIPFLSFLERKIRFPTMLLQIAIHTIAGFVSYHYARWLWSWDMVVEHRDRYLETGCRTDLNVVLFTGIIIEIGATMVDTWLGRQKTVQVPIIDEFIKMSIVSVMVVSGKCLSSQGIYLKTSLSDQVGLDSLEMKTHLFNGYRNEWSRLRFNQQFRPFDRNFGTCRKYVY